MIHAKDAALTPTVVPVARAQVPLPAEATPCVTQARSARATALWAAQSHLTGIGPGPTPPAEPGLTRCETRSVQRLAQLTVCATAPDGNRAHAQKGQTT